MYENDYNADVNHEHGLEFYRGKGSGGTAPQKLSIFFGGGFVKILTFW